MLKIPKVVGESLAPGEVVEWTAYGIRPIESRTAYLPLLIGAAIGFAIHQTTGILNSALMIGLGCGAGQLVDRWREDDKLRGEGEPGGAQTRLVLTSGRFLVVGRPALLGLTWSKVEHALERNEVASISLSERNLGYDHHHLDTLSKVTQRSHRRVVGRKIVAVGGGQATRDIARGE
jgi:hypothetical protein